MEDSQDKELRDYKFFCFGGVCRCFKIDFDRFIQHRANYFDAEGHFLNIGEEICPPDPQKAIKLPNEIHLMEELAAILSRTSSFLRVDFYDVDGEIYFGELTLFPASGFGKLISRDNDELIGKWIELPKSIGVGMQ